MKRIRQRPTVWRVMPRAAATSPLCPPSAQRKTIRARSAKAWAVVRRRASLSSSSRCSEVSTNAAFGLPNRIAALLVRRNGNASDIVLLFLGQDTSAGPTCPPCSRPARKSSLAHQGGDAGVAAAERPLLFGGVHG